MNSLPSQLLQHLKQIFISLLSILQLLIRTLLKPFILTLCLILVIILLNWSNIIFTVSKYGIREWTLVKDFVEVILSFPVAILVLGILFILKFRKPLQIFLENSRLSQIGPVAVSQSQTQNRDLESETGKTDHKSENDDRVEKFEFLYLNLALVLNTKQTLAWFYFQSGKAATKASYIEFFNFPTPVPNPVLERETILNVLLLAQLLKAEDTLFRVTDKGTRFLKFINFIP